MQDDEVQGKSTKDLHDALHQAGLDASKKWGQGQPHRAKARIEVELSPNPGSIREYTVHLSKL